MDKKGYTVNLKNPELTAQQIADKLNGLSSALDISVLRADLVSRKEFEAGQARFQKVLDTKDDRANFNNNRGAGKMSDLRYHGAGLSAVTHDTSLTGDGTVTSPLSVVAAGSGTVKSVSVVSANGLSGTVASGTTTPAITLSTTVTGILKGNGTAISAATPDVDYTTPTGVEVMTNKDLSSGTNTFPTFNQNTTGTAASATALQTVRTIWGQNFQGTANVTGDITLGVSNLTMTGSIASTGARVTKGWYTDIESTNMPTVGGTAILTSLTAPQFTTIELGNASDTTLSRSSGGVLAVEGVVLPSISSTNTLTNKRITKRTTILASSATPSINTDNFDFVAATAQAVNITSMTTNLSGTPTEAQNLWVALTAASGTPTVVWGSSFEDSTAQAPTGISTTRKDVGFVWNTVTSKWRCVASA